MTKQQCQICMGWFEDSELDAHLNQHVDQPGESGPEEFSLKCPVCNGTEFDRESGIIEGSWGQSHHRLVLMVCRKCLFAMPFFEGRTIWGGVTLKQKKLDSKGLPQANEE